MKKGIVMFVYRDDVVESKAYQTVWERKDIVKKWQQKYRIQWGENCAIQIYPSYNVNGVLVNGENQKNVNDKVIRFNNKYERA